MDLIQTVARPDDRIRTQAACLRVSPGAPAEPVSRGSRATVPISHGMDGWNDFNPDGHRPSGTAVDGPCIGLLPLLPGRDLPDQDPPCQALPGEDDDHDFRNSDPFFAGRPHWKISWIDETLPTQTRLIAA